MTDLEFKVGDRVIVVGAAFAGEELGKVGTVIDAGDSVGRSFNSKWHPYKVELDDNESGELWAYELKAAAPEPTYYQDKKSPGGNKYIISDLPTVTPSNQALVYDVGGDVYVVMPGSYIKKHYEPWVAPRTFEVGKKYRKDIDGLVVNIAHLSEDTALGWYLVPATPHFLDRIYTSIIPLRDIQYYKEVE